MDITDRYYPYPVLGGKSQAFGDGAAFDVTYTSVANSKMVVVEVLPVLKEPGIEALITQGLAAVYCHVECPATAYRKAEKLVPNSKNKIILRQGQVAGDVQLCTFVVAESEINPYSNDSFVGFYKGKLFDVEKGGLLAVGDGTSFFVEMKDSRIADAMSPIVLCAGDEDSKIITVNIDANEASIKLPPEQYKRYKDLDDLKSVTVTDARNHELLVSLAVVPALVEMLSRIARCELQDGSRNVQEYEDFDWYKFLDHIVGEYLEENGTSGDLSTIDFSDHPVLTVAQYIAKNPIAAAFKRLEAN